MTRYEYIIENVYEYKRLARETNNRTQRAIFARLAEENYDRARLMTIEKAEEEMKHDD